MNSHIKRADLDSFIQIPAVRRIGGSYTFFIYAGGTMTSYFHIAPVLLGPGSLIAPGNFGRILSNYVHPGMAADNALRLAREGFYEIVRMEKFPHLPSRMRGCFAFTSLEQALQGYAPMTGYFSPVIYEVEIIDPVAPSHLGDFGLITDPQNTPWHAATIERAHRYWAGTQGDLMELLTLSPLRIKRVVHGHAVPSVVVSAPALSTT